MKKLLMALAWSACLLAGSAWAAPDPVQNEEELVKQQAKTLLWWGDFDALEQLHATYQQPDQRTPAGRSRLVLFREGMDAVLDGPRDSRDAYFTQMEALTLQWAQAHPRSALAHVLHAQALLAHGWSYRGRGYMDTVPPDAQRDFQRYVRAAIQYVADHQADVMRSSSGYVLLLWAGRAAGWELEKLQAIAVAGLAINDDDEGLLRGVLLAALPKWGGSADDVDAVIQDMAQRTAARHGDIFYSRMYAWASEWEFHQQLFNNTRASWPRMKAGYEQQIQRYPTALNLNGYAHMACLARDKPRLVALLQRIGDAREPGMWGTNGTRTLETCQRWAQTP